MATLTVQDASAGLGDVTFAAADAGGDEIPSGSQAGGWFLPVALLVINDDTVTHDVTVGSLAAVTVAASGGVAIIPASDSPAIGDLVSVAYDDVTSVTVAAVKLVDVVI